LHVYETQHDARAVVVLDEGDARVQVLGLEHEEAQAQEERACVAATAQ
jgi:hypothetical protein